MGGGDLNLKKSWHPSTMKNMEKVWKAEQQKHQEKKRIAELKREIEMEKDREDMTRYAMEQGVIEKKDDKKLDWMYKGPNQMVNREEYLLGRPIDKSFEQLAQAEKDAELNRAPKNHVEYECIPPSLRFFSGNEQVDLLRKMQEDPLYAIKKKEMDTRSQLLKNPVKLKQLKELLEQQTRKSKSEKKSKKKKAKHKHDSDESDDEAELDNLLASKYKQLKEKINEKELLKSMKKLKRKQKKSARKREDSSDDSESSSDESVEQSKVKKRKKKRRSSSSDSCDSEDKRKVTKHRKKGKNRGSDTDESDDKVKAKKRKHKKVDSCNESDEKEMNEKKKKKKGSHSRERASARAKEVHRRRVEKNDIDDTLRVDKIKRYIEDNNTKEKYKDSSHKRKERVHKHDREASREGKPRHRENDSCEGIENDRHTSDDRYSSHKPYGLIMTHDTKPSSRSKHFSEIPRKQYEPEKKQEQKWVTKRKQHLSEEEKERRRQEMIANANWRDKEREQNVRQYREEEKKEVNDQKTGHTEFIRKQLVVAAEVSTVASRIKANINNIQRSGRAMDTNFARR